MQVTHNNHFVPQWYLKRWADNDQRLWYYRLLVSHESVPLWETKHVSGVAFKRDLYTTVEGGQDFDDFERWIETEFEAPALDAVDRVIHDEELTSTDWKRLALFAAAQDLRTPQDFIESMLRWDKVFPQLLTETLERSVNKFEEHVRTGKPLPTEHDHPTVNHLQDALKIHIRPDAHPETGQGEVGVEVLLGRKLWLQKQRHLLDGVCKIAFTHCWSIVEPADGIEWFTSDHPVVRMNYYTEGNFDIQGGWGKKNGNIFLPLSPRHLLFTEIGKTSPLRMKFHMRQTMDIYKALALRAHRAIYAHKPLSNIEKMRARVVDSSAYNAEQELWNKWHTEQCKAQQEYDSSR